jgi:glutaredoxin-like YruB-family protein
VVVLTAEYLESAWGMIRTRAFKTIRGGKNVEEITVYTTSTCPWCTKVKSYLDEKGIVYREVDVTADVGAARQMLEVTGQRSVPVVTKGSDYVIGFNREEIDRILH